MRHPVGKVQLLKSLKSLGRARREIVALYLFGSQATGKVGPLSDVDVAALIDEKKVPVQKLFKFRLNLIAEIMHACRRPDVDAVILNEATPLLRYEVICSGKLVCERDRKARIGFEARAVQHYLDLKPFYRVSRSYLKRQLLQAPGRG